MSPCVHWCRHKFEYKMFILIATVKLIFLSMIFFSSGKWQQMDRIANDAEHIKSTTFKLLK